MPQDAKNFRKSIVLSLSATFTKPRCESYQSSQRHHTSSIAICYHARSSSSKDSSNHHHICCQSPKFHQIAFGPYITTCLHLWSEKHRSASLFHLSLFKQSIVMSVHEFFKRLMDRSPAPIKWYLYRRPGPFMRWIYKSLGRIGIFRLLKFGFWIYTMCSIARRATAQTGRA